MKFTVFGLTLSSSWGNGHATPYRALLRALHGMGHETTFYEKDVPYYAKHRDFRQCHYCDLVLYPGWEAIRSCALKKAAESDVVLTASYLPEGAAINDQVLELERPARVFYDLDTPLTLAQWRAGGSVEYVRPDQIARFDLVLSFTGGRSLTELENKHGARTAKALYGCVDPEVHRNSAVPVDYQCALSYMATYAMDRQAKVEHLFLNVAAALSQERFVLAGPLYPWNMPVSGNVKMYPHVSPDDHWAIYSGSNATLNITRQVMAENGHCPSGRLFEAAACGTPVISDLWEGLGEFFTEGEDILLVETAEDVISALGRGRDELRRIGNRAREKTLALHTGEQRARELLTAIEEARSPATPAEAAR